MSTSKAVYFSSAAVYLAAYTLGSSWVPGAEEGVSWSRLLFLLATLLLLDKYPLVPEPLTRPPFYTGYKVVVSLLIANVALMTLWWQIEDFIKWSLSSLAALFQYVPFINRKLEFGESDAVTGAFQLLVSLYFLCWVLLSKGFLERLKNGNSPECTPTPQQTAPRRRRSSVRHCAER